MDRSPLKLNTKIYQQYLNNCTSNTMVHVNYLELGRRIIAENYDYEPTSEFNQIVINSILRAAEEKLGRRYLPSLRKVLENRLRELNLQPLVELKSSK